jgi:hypothetical protein
MNPDSVQFRGITFWGLKLLENNVIYYFMSFIRYEQLSLVLVLEDVLDYSYSTWHKSTDFVKKLLVAAKSTLSTS